MVTRRHPLDELTARQREVLSLVARGMTNGQIAEHLGISLDGAKWHVSEIITRFGVSSREEAAAIWRHQQRPMAKLRRLAGLLWFKPAAAVGGGVAAGIAVGVAVAVAMALSNGSDTPAADDSTPPADSTVAATATPDAPAISLPGGVTGLFSEPRPREPDEFVDLPSASDPGFSESTWEVYAYDAQTGAIRTFGFGSVPLTSPDGRWMLWYPAPEGMDAEMIEEVGPPLEGEITVVELPDGEPRSLGDLGQSAWWYRDDALLFWPEGESLQSIDLPTGQARSEPGLQQEYASRELLARESPFPEALPPGLPVFSDGSLRIDYGKDAEVAGPHRAVRLQVPPAQTVFEFSVSASLLADARSLRTGYAAAAPSGKYIIPVPTTDVASVNLFVLDTESRTASFLATADVGATPTRQGEGGATSPLPIVANDRYVAWTDVVCGSVGQGLPPPSTKIFDRETGNITDLGHAGIPDFFTDDGLLALSSTGWGANRLLDLEALEIVTEELPGRYNRWSADGRYAVGGGIAGGHDGWCV